MLTTITILLLTAAVIVQLVFWRYVFRRLPNSFLPAFQPGPETIKITVLICAKNESENLKANLPHIINQDYGNFDILVANDFSSDDTEAVLQSFADNNPSLSYFNVARDISGKKYALLQSLPRIESDWILLTDADCTPVDQRWISGMVSAIRPGDKAVLGYSPSRPGKSVLEKWVHFENWLIGVQYLSYALNQQAYMGVGRNLLVEKDSYPLHILQESLRLPGGDDDLVVQAIARSGSVGVSAHPHTYVYTNPPDNLRAYILQKTRHYSTATAYSNQTKIRLGLFSVSQIIFYACLGVLIFGMHWKIALIALILRWTLIADRVFVLARQLHAGFSILWFPIYDLLLTLHYAFFSFTFLIKRRQTWN